MSGFQCVFKEGVEFSLFVEGHGVNLCAGKVRCGFGHEFDGVIPLPMVRKGVERLLAEHVFVLMERLRAQIAERLLFGVFACASASLVAKVLVARTFTGSRCSQVAKIRSPIS